MIRKITNPLIEKSKFLIIPKPFHNEIFTSWLIRSAYAHNIYPTTFLNMYFPKKRFIHTFSSNFDASVSNVIIEGLSYKTKLSYKSLYNLTLRSYSGYLQEKIIDNGVNKFLTNFRFCPKCFKEDKVPFLRKEWKVVFSTFCQKHKCLLLNSCPQCNSKFNPIKMYQNKLKFNYCHKCGFDLSKSNILSLNSDYLYSKNLILNKILKDGYFSFSGIYTYSFLFFDVFSHMCKLVLVSKKKIVKSKVNSLFFKEINKKQFKSSSSSFHQLTIKEQYMIFGYIMSIFSDYPQSFKKFIKINNLTNFELKKDFKNLPFWYEESLNKYCSRLLFPSRNLTTEEIDNAIKFLKKRNMIINQSNLTKYLGCNFFSSYNKLKDVVFNKTSL